MCGLCVQNMSKEDREACEEAVDHIIPMLSVTPNLRPSAADVFSKDFFDRSLPLPTPRAQLACLGEQRAPEATSSHAAGAPPARGSTTSSENVCVLRQRHRMCTSSG